MTCWHRPTTSSASMMVEQRETTHHHRLCQAATRSLPSFVTGLFVRVYRGTTPISVVAVIMVRSWLKASLPVVCSRAQIDTKTQAQRDRYDETLGQGQGGIPDIIQDPCYHKACDSIQNVNVFAFEKMVQAAAYMLESLGRQDELKAWLYPDYEIQRLGVQPQKRSHLLRDSMDEYVNAPDS